MSTIERFSSEILLPDLLPQKASFPTGIKEYIGNDSSHTLSNIGEAIRTLGDQNNKSLINYLNISYILLLEKEKYLNNEYHAYYIYLIKQLSKIGPLDKSILILQTANASVSRATNPPITLDNLILEFNFLKLLKTEGFDVGDQLGSIEALTKTKIFSSLSSLEDIEAALVKLEKAHRSGMSLMTTKKALLTIIATFFEPIPQNKLMNFKNRLISIETPYNNELEVADAVVEESFKEEGLTKLRVVHMNNESDPKISVWECTRYGISGRVALKEMTSFDLAKIESFKKEAEILERLSKTGHQFFVKYYGSSFKQEKEGNRVKHVLRMEMEFVETSLNKHREDRRASSTAYSELEIANIFMQILTGFNTMNQMKILHNDIKPSNLLITDDFIVKVIDFNISRELRNTTIMETTVAGTVQFMAPEVREAYDQKTKLAVRSDKSDIFSLGLTLLFLVVDEPIVDLNLKKNESTLISMINSVKFVWLRDYLKRMLNFNQSQRVSLKDLNVIPSNDSTQFN
jgi:hypothetical protein